MTHDEAISLLPSYALGALDEPAALEQHLDGCSRCRGALAAYLETTALLGEAVEEVTVPAALRERILQTAEARHADPTTRPVDEIGTRQLYPRQFPGLDHRPTSSLDPERAREIPPRPWRARHLWGREGLAAAAVILVLLAGTLGAADVAQQRQLAQQQQRLALDDRGLALLTSTETANERLNPVAGVPATAHGHWYHRDGVQTQVVVVEFLPAPPSGQTYVGWLQHADGHWQSTGSFTLDTTGYGRIIVVGSDGRDVREVLVTRQAAASSAPVGASILRWTR